MSKGRGLERTRYGWMVLMGVTALLWIVLIGTCWAGNGVLKVITEPKGAEVNVDTLQTGVTPCTLEAPEGKRKITIRLRGHFVKILEVEVSSAEPKEIKVTLLGIPQTAQPGNPRYCQLPQSTE